MTFFSILLPSKNGEQYIENVIKSILDQDFTDYEIIIGDNNNTNRFIEKIKKFNNKKIKIFRSNITLEVAKSWSNCLNNSSGKYIITLGDDDCLLFDGLNSIYKLLNNYNFPDCLSVNGIGFYESQSSLEFKNTAYKPQFWDYKKNFLDKGYINDNEKKKIIKGLFSFKNLLPLNMQPHIFTKDISNLVSNGLFQPSAPDTYAICSLLMKSKKWCISDKKVFAIGMSRKSFGYFYHNNKISEGKQFLGSELAGDFITGSVLNDYLYTTLNNLKTLQPEIFKDYKINRSAYLSRQFFVSVEKCIKEKTLFYLKSYLTQLKKKEILKVILGLLDFSLYCKGMKRLLYILIKKDFNFQKIKVLDEKINIYDFTRKKKL
jgi:glycosyltransferase involved in cell wall biosynthesis